MFYFEPFGYNVQIVLTDNIQQTAAKFAKKYKCADPTTSYTGGFSIQIGGHPISLLVLPYEQRWDIIAHEAFHIVWHLMAWIGAAHEEEVMAYCLDTIVGWVGKVYEALDKSENKLYNGEYDRNSGRKVEQNGQPAVQRRGAAKARGAN